MKELTIVSLWVLVFLGSNNPMIVISGFTTKASCLTVGAEVLAESGSYKFKCYEVKWKIYSLIETESSPSIIELSMKAYSSTRLR